MWGCVGVWGVDTSFSSLALLRFLCFAASLLSFSSVFELRDAASLSLSVLLHVSLLFSSFFEFLSFWLVCVSKSR